MLDQILETEKRMTDRQQLINQTRAKIIATNEMTRRKHEELDEMKNKLKLAVNKLTVIKNSNATLGVMSSKIALLKSFQKENLCEEQIGIQLMSRRLECLRLEKTKVFEERQTLDKELEMLEATYEANQDAFCQKVNEFTADYYILGNGAEHRKCNIQKQIETLKQEKEHLLNELRELEKTDKEFETKKKTNNHLQNLLKKSQQLLKERKDEYTTMIDHMEALKAEKKNQESLPIMDPEFKRLQDTLKKLQD